MFKWVKDLFSSPKKESKEISLTKEQLTIVDEMQRIKPAVADILKKYPETKDDDSLLLVKFWDIQTKGELKTFQEFCYLLTNKHLTHAETIRRTRQKLQEKYPELRGELYEVRKKLEKIVSTQMTLDL